MPWVYWVVTGIVLLIFEIFTPGFILACLGIGCIVTGMVSVAGVGPVVQGLTFCVTTLAVFAGIRPLYLKLFSRKALDVRTNVDALAGRTGIVTRAIDGADGSGRAKVGGEDWRAVCPDDSHIDIGQKIEVLAVEGTKLVVRAVPSQEE